MLQVGARAYSSNTLESGWIPSPLPAVYTGKWNPADFIEIYASLLEPDGENYKFFDFPNCNYSSASYDRVIVGGRTVGFSMFGCYSDNERIILSLGVVDPDIDVGTRKPAVEPHEQLEVRVRVNPTPYVKAAREVYKEGWRTRQS